MTNTSQQPDPWETGELGASMEHAVAAPPELSAQVDAALGLAPIELRLDIELLASLRSLAGQEGLIEKALIRRILGDYVQAHCLPGRSDI